jgi:peptidoglycan/LPS O-acetylase OafA/YrhL
MFVLVVLGAAALALAIIVLVRNKSPDDELLATVAVLGGLAMVVVALNQRNGNGT